MFDTVWKLLEGDRLSNHLYLMPKAHIFSKARTVIRIVELRTKVGKTDLLLTNVETEGSQRTDCKANL